MGCQTANSPEKVGRGREREGEGLSAASHISAPWSSLFSLNSWSPLCPAWSVSACLSVCLHLEKKTPE